MDEYDAYAQQLGAGGPDPMDEYARKLGANTGNPDDALGGTLRVAGMDTHIPLHPAIEAFLVKGGHITDRIINGLQPDSEQRKAAMDDADARIAPLEQKYPIATGLGSALPAMAVPVGLAGGAVAALMKAGLAGALPGLAEYGSMEDRAKRGGLGALGGVAGGAGGLALGRVLNPVRGAGPEAIESITSAAKKFDVPITAGQATQSAPMQYFESALAQLPGSAGRMAKVQGAQQTGLNKATANIIGAESETFTPKIVKGALENQGGKIGDLTSSGFVPLNEQLVNDLAGVESRYMKRLPSQQRPVVQRYIDEILAHDGAIPGDVYQGIRSDLGADVAGASKGSFKNALGGIQKALDRGFAGAADDATNSALALARQRYGDAKTLEGLAKNKGNVSAARLGNVTGGSRDLTGLSEFAANLKPLPDTGTAQRGFWMDALTNNPQKLIAPASLFAYTGVPFAASQLVTRNPGKHYLTKGLLSVDDDLEKLLIRYPGLLGGVGASGALQR